MSDTTTTTTIKKDQSTTHGQAAADHGHGSDEHQSSPLWKEIAVVIILVALVGGVFWLVTKYKGANNSQPTPNAQDEINQIRQAFQAPSPSNVAGVATGTAMQTNPGSQQNPVIDVSPRGGIVSNTVNNPVPAQTPPANPAPAPVYQAPPAQPTTQFYQNQNLGFNFTVPYIWQISNADANTVAFFNGQNGQEMGSIEIYPNTSNESLNDLDASLKNSPDVTSTRQTSLGGQSAIAFTAYNQSQSGIAAIYNNKVYYLRGI